ncbi:MULTISPECIES: hypothetical protein [Pontibacillus]|uniref:Uncharacterized protein n=1 Tax=Pontibacillus chungwhensis TaxID=265426 RepID=A0ABY8UWH0_9BACI|nr:MULTISPECIES: hypothetical protein [Pontibacillus]WIF97685.1 hypothetical protein QNI29_18450 [Pontibacillus chungwhensis]
MDEQKQWVELMREVIQHTEGSAETSAQDIIDLMKQRLQSSVVTE